MVEAEELKLLLDKVSEARYADIKRIREKDVEVAYRSESFEVYENQDERIICRVLDKGYGIASTDKISLPEVREALNMASSQARYGSAGGELAPVKVEEGFVEHPKKKDMDLEEAKRLILDLVGKLRAKLSGLHCRCEIVLTFSEVESSLVSSEGADVAEKSALTDLTVYVVVRDVATGFASRTIGGKGGLEVLEGRDLDALMSELAARAKDGLKAQMLSPLSRGVRFKVVMDSEAAGALAHEAAHMLEADVHQRRLFRDLKLYGGLEVVDNPLIPGGYGSFMWDDEGVRGRRKVLLKEGVINLLHTRLTAGAEGVPGNAHGVTHLPKPCMSNVYVNSGDWGVGEMFQETGSGIFVRGVVRAEVDTSDGRLELIPEIAYLVKGKEVATPIKHLKIIDNVRALIQRIDAVGKLASLRPNLEKGFSVSEGGPYIRVNGAHCC